MFRPMASKILRRTAYGVGGVTLAGTGAVAAYTSTEQGLGLKRELKFWGTVTPVVFDYWWNSSSNSPLVKYQAYMASSQQSSDAVATKTTAQTADYTTTDKKAIFQELHDRNAPKIFNIMLELGGLYIKLGQVLSVTALPVPKQYRELFRTLQSSVPGHEEFEKVIKPTLERELGAPVHEIFEFIEEVPCGSASIGQAHKAVLKRRKTAGGEENVDVIVKVQYPDAIWAIPADIHCVGEFLQLCVYFGVVDESAAGLSYEEFSRQFLAELDYEKERENLEEVYNSSLDKDAPYMRRGVEIPNTYPNLCSERVITMSYLPGEKFEEEARKQLESLGFDTSQGMRSVIRDAAKEEAQTPELKANELVNTSPSKKNMPPVASWKMKLGETVGRLIGVDTILSAVRLMRRMILWSTVAAVKSIHAASAVSPLPHGWYEWAQNHEQALSQAKMLEWTNDAIDALFDVHGYQIFNQGLFNADVHPGNILVIQDGSDLQNSNPKIGLIDYGQCKRLNPEERKRVAKLIVSVANDDSDEVIASHFRDLGIKTKNDSTKFLGDFARLMFGPFKPEHMKHEWHRSLHEEDRVLYFPNELSMVYRTAMLLRGLAMSFQLNVSVGEKWRDYAQEALET